MDNMTSECLLQNIMARIKFAEASCRFGESKNIEVFINDRAYSMLISLLHLNRFSYSTDIEIYGYKVHVVNDADSGVPEFWLGEKYELREFDM